MGLYIYIRYLTPKRKEREYYKLMRRLQPLSDLRNRQLPRESYVKHLFYVLVPNYINLNLIFSHKKTC